MIVPEALRQVQPQFLERDGGGQLRYGPGEQCVVPPQWRPLCELEVKLRAGERTRFIPRTLSHHGLMCFFHRSVCSGRLL